MIKIPLTQGFEAVIDDIDAHLAKHKWYAQRDPCGVVYARRWVGTVSGKQISERLHRAVMGVTDPNVLIDHKDGDGLNCTRANLRMASALLNARNLGGPRRNNRTSPFLGVTMRHGKYRARIRHGGKLIQIGTFATAEEAHEARLAFEARTWGSDARAGRVSR